MKQALSFFTKPGEDHPEAIDQLNKLAPKAYAPGKKRAAYSCHYVSPWVYPMKQPAVNFNACMQNSRTSYRRKR
nr:MAG TPA: hypothetical protein [Caudoviricetes sp.]